MERTCVLSLPLTRVQTGAGRGSPPTWGSPGTWLSGLCLQGSRLQGWEERALSAAGVLGRALFCPAMRLFVTGMKRRKVLQSERGRCQVLGRGLTSS